MGERNSLRVLVVRAKVSRSEWENSLRSVQWMRSLNNTQFLLDFTSVEPIVTQSSSEKTSVVESTATP